MGTIQLHADALVMTMQVVGYNVRRVMIDQSSETEIMYLDLFKCLGFKLEDLDLYDFSLIGFDGSVTIPKGRIQLLILMGIGW